MRRLATSEKPLVVYDGDMALTRASLAALATQTTTPNDDPAARPLDDLTVQIQHNDGFWHRKSIGGLTTACGLPLPRAIGGPGYEGLARRFETYSELFGNGQLCRKGCFSPHEINNLVPQATEAARIARQREDELEEKRRNMDREERRVWRDSQRIARDAILAAKEAKERDPGSDDDASG